MMSAPPPRRFPRREFLATLAVATVVLGLGWFTEESQLIRFTIPVRTAIVFGLWLATLRRWIPQSYAERAMLIAATIVVTLRTSELTGASNESIASSMLATATTIMVLSLLVANGRKRVATVVVATAITTAGPSWLLSSRDPALLLMLIAFLVFLGLMLFTLDGNSRRADRAEDLAVTDELTKLRNRRGMRTEIEAVLGTPRAGTDAVLLLDLDHFKHLNDTQGHAAGDEALREVADVLRSTTRAQDVVGRWGGEEFLVVLHDVNETLALDLAERLREAVQNLTSVKTSIGVAVVEGTDSMSSWVSRADTALYEAKAKGRNQVVLA